MKSFLTKILRFLSIGLIPLSIVFAAYLYFDPFKVIKEYDDYSYSSFALNRDYVSTTVLAKNLKKHNYNSFIFGSSRTLAFQASSWSKYLSKNDSPYIFDASSESLWGIYTKLKYLDSLNEKVDNVLIILCRDVSFNTKGNSKGHLFIKHPLTSNENNLAFQSEFFKSFLSVSFLKNFIWYKISGTYNPSMAGYVENRKITYDVITNQVNIIDQEDEITKYPKEYYQKRSALFYERKGEQVDSVDRIKKEHLVMLKEIAHILKKHNTNYKVVISPLYEQIKFSKGDQQVLENIFANNIYDFSGKNTFTESYENFYENSHYRPVVGDSILRMIYSGNMAQKKD